jgi:class 3 adenylate cyclase
VEAIGKLTLKGFAQPVSAFRLCAPVTDAPA